MTSTLNKKLLLLGIISASMISGVAADYYYYNDGGSNSITQDTGFSVPEYESQQELVTQLVAPFLLITILLQIGFERALRFAFVDEDRDRSLLDLLENNRPPSVKKESTVMALATAGILVPSPFFQYINEAITIVFGGVFYIALISIGIGALYILYRIIAG